MLFWTIIKKKIHEAFSNNDHNAHFEWIEKLIVNYYDKMYDYQLNKKIDRCIFRGNRLECLDYLRSWDSANDSQNINPLINWESIICGYFVKERAWRF